MTKATPAPKLNLSVLKELLDHDLCHSLDPHHFQAIKKSIVIMNGPSIGYEVHMRDGKSFAASVVKKDHAVLSQKLAEAVKQHCTPKKKAAVKLS